MNEVVVTGSYTKDKRREEVVGSIAQVSSERLQTDRQIESFDKMLEGLVAGVQVETTTELNTPVKSIFVVKGHCQHLEVQEVPLRSLYL